MYNNNINYKHFTTLRTDNRLGHLGLYKYFDISHDVLPICPNTLPRRVSNIHCEIAAVTIMIQGKTKMYYRRPLALHELT